MLGSLSALPRKSSRELCNNMKMPNDKKPLKALILAAGLGTRLRPLTEKTPKCLVKVGSEPVLEYWLRKLEEVGCTSVLVNTHYHADQVVSYLRRRPKSGIDIQTIHEERLLGTAGSLMAYRDYFANARGILIHADNFMEDSLNSLLKDDATRPDNCVLTMLTFTTSDPKSCGIVELNNDGTLIGFHEKVSDPPGNRANAAVYVFDDAFIHHLTSLDNVTDIGAEVIPTLCGKIKTSHTNGFFIDIGNISALEKAREFFSARHQD